MYISVNGRGEITGVSDAPFERAGEKTHKVKGSFGKWENAVGKRFIGGKIMDKNPAKPANELRVAVVCNWNDRCGISTYTKYLVDALAPKVKEVRIFSEETRTPTAPDEDFVVRCWKRGESLKAAIKLLREWKPDFVVVQHEFGIFPVATQFFKLMQALDEFPHAIVLHSVYQHLDKAVYASTARNIIVHSEQGRDVLRSLGNTSNIYVVPHGCFTFPDTSELYNILHTPYTILQFGFGFSYKGVERMLEAVALLKDNDPKFCDIFYCFMLSSNGHNDRAHNAYYERIVKAAEDLGIDENVAIIRKYNSDATLNLALREFKLAVFPYVTDPDNTVYGASGAARIAMANGIPVVTSHSHLFDDLEGVTPRPQTVEELAKTIDEIFSNGDYRKSLLERQKEFVQANTWEVAAEAYLDVYRNVV